MGEKMSQLNFKGKHDIELQNLIRSWHDQAMTKIDSSILPKTLKVELNTRMRTSAGRARINHTNLDKCLIKLHYRLLKDDIKELKNTYIHELAHIYVNLKYGKDMNHGKEFQEAMELMGEKFSRCHDLDISKFTRKKHKIYCACSVRYVMLKKWKNCFKYRCKKCNERILQQDFFKVEKWGKVS